ncbi:MAG: right-handed parallel beta-helix repeat-containing protein [Oscillospiraceae bacterium]|nr:right-handed parallel beta-helix repeat-containing protein [Oscillospiraceae bacterium]
MKKRILSLLLALALCLSLGVAAMADSDSFLDLVGETYEVTEAIHLSRLTIDENSSLTAPEGYVPVVTVDGYLKTIEEGTAYAFYGNVDVYPVADAVVGEALRGASAVYVENAQVSLSDQLYLNYGFLDGEYIDSNDDGELTEDEWVSDTSKEYGSEFGMSAGILANGPEAVLDLNNVTVLTASGSTSNGVFAANAAVVNISDSTVITNNSQGHGLDATFGGTFYVDNCVIRTNGGSSSALSTDFGGGFFKVTNTYAESNTTGSGAIYAAGSSIYVVENSTLHANKSETIMNAHNNSIVVCYNSYLYGPEIFDGHQAMPSPENAVGDVTYSFDCTFEAVDNAIIHEQGGVTTHNIINCDTSACSADYAIQVEYESGMGTGKVYVNLWDTEMTGDIYCYEGGVVELNLYDGAVFTGEVIMDGECDVTINVYNGGEYIGEYEANYIDETVEASEFTEDTYGSIEWLRDESGLWAAGSSWSSYETSYVTYVQPVIVANSTEVTVVEVETEAVEETASTEASAEVSASGEAS